MVQSASQKRDRPAASDWPWGLPWNDAAATRQVEDDNTSIRFSMRVAHELAKANQAASVMIGAPEQLGTAPRGTPASFWNLPEIRAWARKARFWRLAVYQCELGPSETPKPTAFLINHPLPLPQACRGWPTFEDDHSAARYTGPLATRYNCT